MPPLIPTISVLFSPKNSWHRPSEHQSFFLQYSEPCPWWTSSNSTPTFVPPYLPTPSHPFTSNPKHLTHDGPWTPMVSSEKTIESIQTRDLFVHAGWWFRKSGGHGSSWGLRTENQNTENLTEARNQWNSHRINLVMNIRCGCSTPTFSGHLRHHLRSCVATSLSTPLDPTPSTTFSCSP